MTQNSQEQFRKDLLDSMPILYGLIWVIPGLLVPAGIANFFFGGQDLIHLLLIVGFAFALYFILKCLLKFAEKRLKKVQGG